MVQTNSKGIFFLKVFQKFFSFSLNFQVFFKHFLAIFCNEKTTILTLSTSEGGGGGSHVFRFEGPWLRIRNVNILLYIYVCMDKVASFFVIYRQKHSNRYFRCTEHVNANKKNKYFIIHKWTNDKLCTALWIEHWKQRSDVANKPCHFGY